MLAPAVGGLVATHLRWRRVFYINITLGIAAFITSLTLLRLPVIPVKSGIDFLGAARSTSISGRFRTH
ncbi:hypothetical protein [Streptomyces sp. NPDC050485]|uniref:hypothetical protein n=1 Tax=Streptomyces sp. NPDC050485 TaxID=3365617 RepID=UPI0037B06C02